jgi:hypothetical protein
VKRTLILVALVLGFAPAFAMAQNSSPYVVGQWNLQDTLKDFKGSALPILTENTVFIFLNPTPLTLTLEYAFFASDGTFCGCDRDTLKPNGRTRYTMVAEQQGGQFSQTLCPSQSDGTMKSIVFESSTSIGTDRALQAGLEIHIAGQSQRTESDLDAVPVTSTTTTEMKDIHAQCVKFIGS